MKILKILIVTIICLKVLVNADTNSKWILDESLNQEFITLNDIDIITPEELKEAIERYNKGEYKYAADLLQKLRRLNLPDGKLDFITFALGECYRKSGVTDQAADQYRFVAENFPESDKVPPSLYRLLEYAAVDGNVESADSIFMIYQNRFKNHLLFNSIIYLCGKIYYDKGRYGEAVQLLLQVDKKSSRYLQSQFLTGLCYLNNNEYKNALSIFDTIQRTALNVDLSTEATIITGDIYYNQNDILSALKYYNKVPVNASRYQYALVKIARAHLDLEHIETARSIAKKFLNKYDASDYYFEMASILQQVYSRSGNEQEALKVSNLIQRQIVDARLTFEIFEEIDHLTDIAKIWQIYEYDAIRTENKKSLEQAQKNIENVNILEAKLRQLLNDVNGRAGKQNTVQQKVPHLAERRYMNIIRKNAAVLSDSIQQIKNIIGEKSKQKLRNNVDENQIDSLTMKLDKLTKAHTDIEHEYALVIKECLDGDDAGRRIDEEMQAKFIDWSFMSYQAKKKKIKELALELSKRNKRIGSSDSTEAGVLKTSIDSIENELKQLNQSLTDDRKRITNHMETMLQIYPKNRYYTQICFRLAELYYDEAENRFERELRIYDQKIAAGDNTSMQFPEYDLTDMIKAYNRIIEQYPDDELADDAYFYKARALQKLSNQEEANQIYKTLVQKFPESEYYVEANMSIGQYYFEHPKEENGQGYKLSEDAYRKVLYYRDHPQFVQALYHLGWCYYMQDRYEDAIAVFKYLVEEANLNFDPAKMEDEQVVNPLLRGEAIDYIAISFNEDGRLDDAIQFLQMIGNVDYSAMVLKRIAELREEDLDLNTAASVYRKLLKEFPTSTVAPEAMGKLIKIYDSKDSTDSSLAIRAEFFKTFVKGSAWQTDVVKRDSLLVQKVDSMAISIGLYIGDESYRKAENTRNFDDYTDAAHNYQLLVNAYPDHPKAAEARWNLAVIQETKIDQKPLAYENYTIFSKLKNVDVSRREQAALNALALAQSLLPDDSLNQNHSKSLDFAAKKVIEASQNYMKEFSNGSSTSKVILATAALYFNRKLFTEADREYQKIIALGASQKDYYEALFLSGQCNFGLDKWSDAILAFDKIWKNSDSPTQRDEAFKLLLQSEFMNAKTLASSGNFEKAAIAFKTIDDKYPGSTYGDIVLFNASEAYEKKEMWAQACDIYYNLVNKYPNSKFAPDALFNAAEDYEKLDKYQKAADAYELLVQNYPQSEKAKDALFNLGFCYEKLGKMEKMAEINERYSALYPDERDVESLLLRSAAFYLKASMFEKAIVVYRNYIRRFPKSAKSIEAQYMVGKCFSELGDFFNAYSSYSQTELFNNNLARDGFDNNNYYAAEAAFASAKIKEKQFTEIKLVLPEEQLKASLKQKSEYLNEAVKAYQRVVQYQSEKMFEASYLTGLLYVQFAQDYQNQEREKTDPIKAAVHDKDILIVTSQLIQKSFPFFENTLKIGSQIDSLNAEQSKWVVAAKNSLIENFIKSGEYQLNAIDVMQNAPIPKEIRDEPLHYYQYLKQLYETLEPLKTGVLDYYSAVLEKLDSLKIDGQGLELCRNEFARVNYLQGYAYDRLAGDILKNVQELPKSLSSDEREELIFQLEDIVFELQDKAGALNEEALERVKQKNLQTNQWYTKIIECLARLKPEKYGLSFYSQMEVPSGSQYFVRTDSIAKWNSKDPPKDGWMRAVRKTKGKELFMKSSEEIWGDMKNQKVYLWRNLFLSGQPREASVYVNTKSKYKLYINGSLTLNDTVGKTIEDKIDSATGIVALVNGGDNFVAVEADAATDDLKGIKILFTALIDTTQKFSSTVKIPQVADVTVQEQNDSAANKDIPSNTITNIPVKVEPVVQNRDTLQRRIEMYHQKELQFNELIKQETQIIDSLRRKIHEIDSLNKIRNIPVEPKLKIETNKL